MSQARKKIAEMLTSIKADDEKAFSEVLSALGWGIATMSAMPGDREDQAEFLHQTFKAIVWDAGRAMESFEAFRRHQPMSEEAAKKTVDALLSKIMGAQRNG